MTNSVRADPQLFRLDFGYTIVANLTRVALGHKYSYRTLPAGNFGKEKRKKKVTMTERFQLHHVNMIFCFIEARIDQCVYYYPSNKKVRFQCPTSSRFCVCVPLHKAKPRTLSKREESDGFRSHLLIPYHFHSLFRTSQEHPPKILSSLLHTFDLTLIRFSNNLLSRGSWK